jgi:drug/metabolite transporter (DMT)-like permease
MNWFFIALGASLVHSLANFVDKIILQKYFKNFNVLVFLLYSTLTSLILLPFFLLMTGRGVFAISTFDILLLLMSGVCLASALYFYVSSLAREDTSTIVPFLQLIPVCSYILSGLILGEILSKIQFIGSLIIVFGISILSIEVEEEKKIKFRHQIVMAMIAVAVFISLSGVLFKFVASNNDFWLSNFWEFVGFTIVGLGIFVINKKDRNIFLTSVRTDKNKITFAILISECLTLSGNLLLNYALLFAPIALVRVVESYQLVFVFTIGMILTKFLPNIIHERLKWRHFLQKILSIIIVIIGSYLLFLG